MRRNLIRFQLREHFSMKKKKKPMGDSPNFSTHQRSEPTFSAERIPVIRALSLEAFLLYVNDACPFHSLLNTFLLVQGSQKPCQSLVL